MTRGDIDDQILYSAFGHRLQMVANRVNVDTWNELVARLQHMPRLNDKLLQATSGLLHLHQSQLNPRPGPGSFQGR